MDPITHNCLLLSFSVSCAEKKENNNTLLAGLLLFAANQIKVSTATDLVNESAADYNQNNWGLITPQTLARFQSNWQTNKPSHITGNLIILQTDAADRVAGGAASPYVAENPSQGVYVYLLDDYRPVDLPSGGFRFNQTRDTGLFSNSVRYQANGAFVDDWLKTFGINLSKDLVVFAVGTGNGITAGAYPAKAVGAGAPSASAGNQTFVPFEGSIKSSKTFPWADLLKDNADGYEFLDKAAIKTLFDTTRAVYTPGTTIVSQCRTNFEAQVNGFAGRHSF